MSSGDNMDYITKKTHQIITKLQRSFIYEKAIILLKRSKRRSK